jgi:hypothetical protein
MTSPLDLSRRPIGLSRREIPAARERSMGSANIGTIRAGRRTQASRPDQFYHRMKMKLPNLPQPREGQAGHARNREHRELQAAGKGCAL